MQKLSEKLPPVGWPGQTYEKEEIFIFHTIGLKPPALEHILKVSEFMQGGET
jgi:hypothetical protein